MLIDAPRFRLTLCWIDSTLASVRPSLLAKRLGADIVLLDEKAARKVAVGRGLRVSGLLGVLREAASRGFVDLPTVVEALPSTGFRASPALLRSLLGTH